MFSLLLYIHQNFFSILFSMMQVNGLFFVLAFFCCFAAAQNQISQVLCDGYNITYVSDTLCLSNEKTFYVNDIWVGCWRDDDTIFSRINNMAQSLCNNGNAIFLSSLPNQQIQCGTHKIVVAPSFKCLSNEYLITLDQVFLSCVSQDDGYLDSLTNMLDAWCQKGETYTVS